MLAQLHVVPNTCNFKRDSDDRPFCIAQATKEAEHRDRLAELRARGDAARERANAEQELIVTSRLRREQADKCAFLLCILLATSAHCVGTWLGRVFGMPATRDTTQLHISCAAQPAAAETC